VQINSHEAREANMSAEPQRIPFTSTESAAHGPGDENALPRGPQQTSNFGQSPPESSHLPSAVISNKLRSPSPMSPSRHGAGWDPRADLPLLPSVSSASQLPLPVPASRASSMSSSLSSIAVFEQSRTLLDKQRNAAEYERQCFAAERALWDTERQALYARVQELEQALNIKNGPTFSKQGSAISPMETGSHHSAASLSNHGNLDTFGSFSNGNGSIHTSVESNGDEFWRGAGARKGSVATRTFSDSSTRSSKAEDRRLPSIAETESPDKPDEVLSTSTNKMPSSSEGPKLNRDFDGIRLKSLAQLPEVAVLTPDSPSPRQVASPPEHIQIPSSVLSAPEDLFKDAGHTPLVRATDPTDDLTIVASNGQTPTQEGPRHPRPSVAHPPSERSNSYFPPPAEDADDEDDTELKGPLSLQNDGQNDRAFLDELDTRLTDAARMTSHESTDTDASENRPPTRTESAPVRSNYDQSEHEPMLRMRRSMNFGAPLGVVRPGML
jgi:hypothetical protein